MQAVAANSRKVASCFNLCLSQKKFAVIKNQASLLCRVRRFSFAVDETSTNLYSERKHDSNAEARFDRWPSVEHAAYAFAKLSSKGSDHCKTTVELHEFVDVITEMNLNFNLSRVEIERVFHQLDENGDGQLSLQEFKIGRSSSPFVKSLVEALSGADHFEHDLDFPDEHFNGDISTADYYESPLSDGFVGEHVSIRESLDYKFHNNYIHKRQRFQDALIRKNVLLDGSKTDRPWLVYTCGPMGAGKGWVLGWMSVNEILPLEQVSKIDPDTFKLRMPEWPIYQTHGCHEVAGSLTHAESSYIAEIAMNVAMNNSMNVWVDGSLRNFEWHAKQFDEIRRKWPQYRIAILAIGAQESTIQSRLEHRAKETGRYVPKNLQMDSFRGFQEGLRHLTRKVDLIASVGNDSARPDAEPELEFVSMIDRSGNWDLIKSLTSFQGNDSV